MIDLFCRNFDEAPAPKPAPEAAQPSDFDTAQVEVNLDELLRQARQAGYEEGVRDATASLEAEYAASDAQRLTEATAAIQQHLAQLVATETSQADAIAHDVEELFLGVAERLVPELLSHYGTALALERLRAALTKIQTAGQLTIKTGPVTVEALNAMLPVWASEHSQIAELNIRVLPNDQATAVSVEWREGRFEYCLESVCAALLAELHRAAGGLSTPPKEAH